ncbi:MAG: B12-binding domain-containing radical SAM protein, partial [Syntrophales bacterium LBB04]|nr:B12-binding domain-containing radical SAM protein [Syntrophales bacterium LBB04]
QKRESINFPWGLAHLATTLQTAGHRVQVLDGQALQLPKERLAPLLDNYDSDVIGISAFSTQFNAVRLLAAHIKKTRKTPVVVGGPLATYQPELTLLETDTDVCVIGDGEITAVQLLENLDDPENVPGIAYKRDGVVRRTPSQDNLVKLDDLPLPDFSLFDMERYLKQRNEYERRESGVRAVTLITSRGCPYSCNFCSRSSRHYRSMSPVKIYETLDFMKREFGIEDISFGDELFLTSKASFRELSPLLKKLDLPWGSQARVNIMDGEFLDMVKDAGCRGLGYGIESGSQKILDNMNKRTKVEQIESAMKNTLARKIPVKVQLIFGYPGEDETTVKETIELFRRVDHPGRRFVLITPIPGSPLYDDCLAKGLIKDEAGYLCAIEKSFGAGKVHFNFTQWPDDELYPRKKAAEKAMVRNYVGKSLSRRVRYLISGKRSLP